MNNKIQEREALLAERRVLVRRGWAGEDDGLFEHPEAVLNIHIMWDIPAIWLA